MSLIALCRPEGCPTLKLVASTDIAQTSLPCDILAAVHRLLEGGTLDEVLREGPLHENTVRIIAERILTGLNGLHGRAMAFVDCKPANVGIEHRGVWSSTTLLDLGAWLQIREGKLSLVLMVQCLTTPDTYTDDILVSRTLSGFGKVTPSWFERPGLAGQHWRHCLCTRNT
jgi:hypothetical protein